MKFAELKKHIKSGNVSDVYLLVGDDGRVIEKALEMLTSLIDDMPQLNITVYDGNFSVTEAEACCRSYPMFASRRAVIIKNCTTSLAAMSDYFTDPQSTTLLIFTATTLTPNFAPYVKHMTVVDCAKLPAETLLPYIAKRAAASGATITVPAANLLIEYTLRDLASIENQLDKLCLITDAIKESDVAKNVTPSLEFKIFELSDAISKKQGERAVKVLRALMSDGVTPGGILSMLENHYRRLMYVVLNRDDDNLASKLGVKEGAVYMSVKAAGTMKAPALKRAYDVIASAEKSFKTGKSTDKEAVMAAVLEALAL